MVFLKSVAWGGIDLPWNKDAPHSVLIGSPGTGKTLLLRMLMKSMLFDKKGQLAARAVVHDPKREMYPALIGMGLKESQIRVIHPLEKRTTPWNIAADFQTREHAMELAHALIPDTGAHGQNAFFYNGARSLLQGVIGVLQESAPCAWTLNDLYEICAREDLLRHVLSQSPGRLERLEKYLDRGKGGDSVLGTMESEISRLMVVAPANARLLQSNGLLRQRTDGGDDGSLRHWFQNTKRGVILLSAHPDHERAVAPLNSAAIAVLGRYTLSQDDNPNAHTFFFIDEARTERPLPRLDGLVRQGRSKNAHVVTVFHTYEGMKGVYKEAADEIMGASLNVCVTASNSPNTRKWVMALGGVSGGRNVQRAHVTIDSWFNQLGNPSEKYGIDGIYKIPGRSPWFGHSKPSFVKKHLTSPSDKHPGFESGNVSLSKELGLDESDWKKRLGIPFPEASKPEKPKKDKGTQTAPESKQLETLPNPTQAQNLTPKRRFGVL